MNTRSVTDSTLQVTEIVFRFDKDLVAYLRHEASGKIGNMVFRNPWEHGDLAAVEKSYSGNGSYSNKVVKP